MAARVSSCCNPGTKGCFTRLDIASPSAKWPKLTRRFPTKYTQALPEARDVFEVILSATGAVPQDCAGVTGSTAVLDKPVRPTEPTGRYGPWRQS